MNTIIIDQQIINEEQSYKSPIPTSGENWEKITCKDSEDRVSFSEYYGIEFCNDSNQSINLDEDVFYIGQIFLKNAKNSIYKIRIGKNEDNVVKIDNTQVIKTVVLSEDDGEIVKFGFQCKIKNANILLVEAYNSLGTYQQIGLVEFAKIINVFDQVVAKRIGLQGGNLKPVVVNNNLIYLNKEGFYETDGDVNIHFIAPVYFNKKSISNITKTFFNLYVNNSYPCDEVENKLDKFPLTIDYIYES